MKALIDSTHQEYAGGIHRFMGFTMTSNTHEVLTFKSATNEGLTEGWRNFWEPSLFVVGLVKRAAIRLFGARLA
jgi:hypothetical protein